MGIRLHVARKKKRPISGSASEKEGGEPRPLEPKPIVRLAFADFWKDFDPARNYFTDLLSQRFEVQLSDDPDLLIYSCFGETHRRYRCIRVFYTGENVRPDFRRCDYAFTFDHLPEAAYPQHYRLPLCYRRNPEGLVKREFDPRAVLAEKTRFCNFVYSNDRCEKRNTFFRKLCDYKPVDSGGKYLNNIGGPVRDKAAFLRQYKFTIAFENESYPGYTTEKIVDPMHAQSLPIYWGNPLVHLDFNPKSFLNYHDHGSDEALIERIIELDQNDELYLEYLRQPWFHENSIPENARVENILARFEQILSTSKVPVAQTWSYRMDEQVQAALRLVSGAVRRVRRG